MQNLTIRVLEEVPNPTHSRILLDGEVEGEDANLKDVAAVLDEGRIEWEKLVDENDPEGTGIIYTHYRRLSYSRLLQGDFPGYMHIQLAPTSELRVEALTMGDASYTPTISPEEILLRHENFANLLKRLRNPDDHRELSDEDRAIDVLYLGTGTSWHGFCYYIRYADSGFGYASGNPARFCDEYHTSGAI